MTITISVCEWCGQAAGGAHGPGWCVCTRALPCRCPSCIGANNKLADLRARLAAAEGERDEALGWKPLALREGTRADDLARLYGKSETRLNADLAASREECERLMAEESQRVLVFDANRELRDALLRERGTLSDLTISLSRAHAVVETTVEWLENGSYNPGDGSPRHAHRALRENGLLPTDHECPVCAYDRAALDANGGG